MTIYIAIIIELLIIAALVLLWLRDKETFKLIWDQIVDLLEEIGDLKDENVKLIAKANKKSVAFVKKSKKVKKKKA